MSALTEITDQLTLVVLGIRIWSGRKKLRAEDLHLSDGEIPPEELVSLGSKRVCDPEPLKPFHRLKQSAERAALRVGTRFLGGFAVPKDQVAGVAAELERLKAEFDAETQSFLASYDQGLEHWIRTLPSFEAAIRRAVEPADVVASRLRFGYQLVEIKPAAQPGTLAEEVQALGDGVFAEVEQMARELATSFEGRDKLHRRALGTFNRVREKLACLSFIDPRIDPVVVSIDDWLGRLPMTAPIAGALFNEGLGLALLLSDAERMARHGAGQLVGEPVDLPLVQAAADDGLAVEADDFEDTPPDGFDDLPLWDVPASPPAPQPWTPAPVLPPEQTSFFF